VLRDRFLRVPFAMVGLLCAALFSSHSVAPSICVDTDPTRRRVGVCRVETIEFDALRCTLFTTDATERRGAGGGGIGLSLSVETPGVGALEFSVDKILLCAFANAA